MLSYSSLNFLGAALFANAHAHHFLLAGDGLLHPLVSHAGGLAALGADQLHLAGVQGGFPADEAKAFGVISTGSLIAAFAKATKVIVKTPHEAVGIPTMEANAQGLRCTKQVVNMMADQTFQDARLPQEEEIISRETRCIVDKCFELGEGDIAVGVCRAVEAGVLDIPFAPCRYNAGLMLPCRDNNGAVRILNPGNLPLTQELKDFHAGKIDERAKAENRKASFQMVIDDVYSIGKGRLVGRPRY